MFEVELERRRTSPVSTVTAHGVLDGRTAEHLTALIDMAADSKRIVIDLADVLLGDNAGLHALIGGIGKVRAAGGEVEVVATPTLSQTLREGGVQFASPRPVSGR